MAATDGWHVDHRDNSCGVVVISIAFLRTAVGIVIAEVVVLQQRYAGHPTIVWHAVAGTRIAPPIGIYFSPY